MSKFIAFDGIDRSGKSTAVKNVAARLVERNLPVRLLKGGHIGGMRVVDYLGTYPDEIVYMLLWQAHRLLDLREVQPAAKNGETVLCDRYVLSNLAHNWWTDLNPGFQSRIQSIYLERCTLPDLYCVFSVPYQVFCERDDGDTPMDEDQFRDISVQYRMWAERLAVVDLCKVLFVDGTMPEEDLCNFLMIHIDKILAEEVS